MRVVRPWGMRKTLLTALVLLAAPALAGTAVQVELHNGDRLSGTLAGAVDSGDLALTTAFAGPVTIPRGQVSAIKSADGATTLWPAPAPDPWETARTVVSPRAYKWSGRVDVGASVDSGNSDEQEYLVDARVEARNAGGRWTFIADSDFSRENEAETENDHTLDVLYDRFIPDSRWFYGARGKAEVDKVADLDLRTRLGPIVGYQFWDRDDLHLIVRTGPEWWHEEYAGQDPDDAVAGFWGLDYEQDIWQMPVGALRAYHVHEISAPLDDADAWVLETGTGVRIPLSERLRAGLGVEFDWANEPPPGVRHQDVTYALKLGYEW